jgi:hypothetical protein
MSCTPHNQLLTKSSDLCTRNKKVFTHEHELFTFADLKKHQKFGDDNPGAIDQSGFKGHPECGFCRQRFYGDDELYTHCRDKHERCHICDRREGSRQQQYYVNYDSLEQHFRKDHFMCPDRECLEKKFVVFDSEMDLKAHQLESHPNGLTKDALRDARRVDMSGFGNYRAPHEGDHGRRDDRRREGGRARGRGRDPNAEAVPASSAQPLSRAELAFQRQREAQQSGASGRTFGGQLSAPTPGEAFAARPTPSASAPATQAVSRPSQPVLSNLTNGVSNLSLNSQPSVPQTPQDQARLLRHNAVTERATNMLRNDQIKLQQFRADVSSYRNDKVSPAQFIEGLFALFDSDSKELGKLVKELADIFEIPAKQQGLLKAWSDWKAINEDYPSLPGSATERALNGGGATSGGSSHNGRKPIEKQVGPLRHRATHSPPCQQLLLRVVAVVALEPNPVRRHGCLLLPSLPLLAALVYRPSRLELRPQVASPTGATRQLQTRFPLCPQHPSRQAPSSVQAIQVLVCDEITAVETHL